MKKKTNIIFLTTVSPSLYFSAKNESISFKTSLPSNGSNPSRTYIIYETLRDFNSNKVIKLNNSFWFTRPILEFQFAIEGNYLLKKGALVYGIKTNLNTEKFETANYTILPEFPAYTSTGSYTLNRSYVGIYAGYRFKKK